MSKKKTQSTKIATVFSDTFSILIVFGILITVNVLVSQFGSFRLDLTKEKLYTLSGGTKGAEGGLYLGAGKDLAEGSFWSGLIDDVRIYDRVIEP